MLFKLIRTFYAAALMDTLNLLLNVFVLRASCLIFRGFGTFHFPSFNKAIGASDPSKDSCILGSFNEVCCLSHICGVPLYSVSLCIAAEILFHFLFLIKVLTQYCILYKMCLDIVQSQTAKAIAHTITSPLTMMKIFCQQTRIR